MSAESDIRDIFALAGDKDIHARDLKDHMTKERGWSEDEYRRARKFMNLKGHRVGSQYYFISPNVDSLQQQMETMMREWLREAGSWETFFTKAKAALKSVKASPRRQATLYVRPATRRGF